MRPHTLAIAVVSLAVLTAAGPASAQSPASTGGTSAIETPPPAPSASPPATATEAPTTTGGAAVGPSALPVQAGRPTTGPVVAGTTARVRGGLALAPEAAPIQVKEAIWAGNQIVGRPYVYGGGHAAFTSQGYDCSGAVSFALHGGSLLRTPMASPEFMSFGEPGPGQWVTIYTNPGHMYAVIAGLRLDTSSQGDPSHLKGARWRPAIRIHEGFQVRHPVGL